MKANIKPRLFIENAAEIARECGCTRSTLHRCLKGTRRPSPALRARIEACGLKLPKKLLIPKGV